MRLSQIIVLQGKELKNKKINIRGFLSTSQHIKRLGKKSILLNAQNAHLLLDNAIYDSIFVFMVPNYLFPRNQKKILSKVAIGPKIQNWALIAPFYNIDRINLPIDYKIQNVKNKTKLINNIFFPKAFNFIFTPI